jgi:hypothetical protein
LVWDIVGVAIATKSCHTKGPYQSLVWAVFGVRTEVWYGLFSRQKIFKKVFKELFSILYIL